MSIASETLRMTGLYEAELLLELMLRFWHHPFAEDEEFRNSLLEAAASVLRGSVDGEKLLEELKPENMNFVAAVYYSEWNGTVDYQGEPDDAIARRKEWLERMRRSIPSCFCDPRMLD